MKGQETIERNDQIQEILGFERPAMPAFYKWAQKKLWYPDWLEAMGLDGDRDFYWKDDTRFSFNPPRCELCGRHWHPKEGLFSEKFIAVFGKIVYVRASPYDGLPMMVDAALFEATQAHSGAWDMRWDCEKLEILCSTGDGRDHNRYVCLRHPDAVMRLGRWVLRDSITGQPRIFSEENEYRPWNNVLARFGRDMFYWIRTVARFAGMRVTRMINRGMSWKNNQG